MLGVGGIMFTGSCWWAFADVPEDIRHMKKSIYRVAMKVRGLIEGARIPVLANQDLEEATSEGFLTHFGFERAEGDIWRYRECQA